MERWAEPVLLAIDEAVRVIARGQAEHLQLGDSLGTSSGWQPPPAAPPQPRWRGRAPRGQEAGRVGSEAAALAARFQRHLAHGDAVHAATRCLHAWYLVIGQRFREHVASQARHLTEDCAARLVAASESKRDCERSWALKAQRRQLQAQRLVCGLLGRSHERSLRCFLGAWYGIMWLERWRRRASELEQLALWGQEARKARVETLVVCQHAVARRALAAVASELHRCLVAWASLARIRQASRLRRGDRLALLERALGGARQKGLLGAAGHLLRWLLAVWASCSLEGQHRARTFQLREVAANAQASWRSSSAAAQKVVTTQLQSLMVNEKRRCFEPWLALARGRRVDCRRRSGRAELLGRLLGGCERRSWEVLLLRWLFVVWTTCSTDTRLRAWAAELGEITAHAWSSCRVDAPLATAAAADRRGMGRSAAW